MRGRYFRLKAGATRRYEARSACKRMFRWTRRRANRARIPSIATTGSSLGSTTSVPSTMFIPQAKPKVPADYKIAAMLAVGWPARPPGPVRRLPVEKVVHHDRW